MIRRLAESLDQILSSWGMSFARLQRRSPPAEGRVVDLFVPVAGARARVGTLSREEGEFVFRYDPAYTSSGRPALPEFPAFDDEYRSHRLWPFFEVRVPPTRRPDVARALVHEHVAEGDVFSLLGTLGRRSPTSPFELELRAG